MLVGIFDIPYLSLTKKKKRKKHNKKPPLNTLFQHAEQVLLLLLFLFVCLFSISSLKRTDKSNMCAQRESVLVKSYRSTTKV